MEPTEANTPSDPELGPNAAAILATEHWSLLATRSLIIAAYARLVQINTEEFELMLAMNRLRRAYVQLEPGLERYFTTGHHDDERGLIASYMLDGPSRRWLIVHFLVNTPMIVATVDSALAAAIVVLLLQLGDAPLTAELACGAVAFALVWGVLLRLQLHALYPLRGKSPRFPTPHV
jgi:hypothetical protein